VSLPPPAPVPALPAAGSPDDGVLSGLAPQWLRANCQCALCLDPVSGQRLAEPAAQPPDVTVAEWSATPTALRVTFGPDGHEAVFSRSWLAGQAAPWQDARSEDAKRLWLAADLAEGPGFAHWLRYLAEPGYRADCLARLLNTGFLVLRGVPAESAAVLAVAETMGYVRETNYGRLFDVQVKAAPTNLADTGRAIAPHTDNPYRDPAPTVQLLHCLTSAVAGGDSGLVDGFRAAGLLRAEHPAAFRTLTRTAVTFRYADATAELTATRPIIGVDPRGRVREIRFNSRSMQPLRRPDTAAPADAAAVAVQFYAAYRAFAAIVLRPALMLQLRLEPGDCMVFDNTRVLHARSGFTDAGDRHLQGCYADLDGIESSLAVLRRQLAAPPASQPADQRGSQPAGPVPA
jgi:gamma-butyrobetaine dioxygenase